MMSAEQIIQGLLQRLYLKTELAESKRLKYRQFDETMYLLERIDLTDWAETEALDYLARREKAWVDG